MQTWQFYLHMLAMCVIILLLYLFFREYKADKARNPGAKSDSVQVASVQVASRQVPLSHSHMQAFMQPTPAHNTAPVTRRFDTDSNLDRELDSEINDLGRTEVVNDCASEAESHTSKSNSSTSSAVQMPLGSPIRQVIEFVPKKAKRSKKTTVGALSAI